MKILFSPPDISELEIQEVTDTLRSGWITTGSKTKRFESEIANFCHTEKAVCLNSQTAAAEQTLRLMGIGSGDEVITSAYTYTASASVIRHVGATPVLIDTALDSYAMDPDKLDAAITNKTKAVIPVDIGGVICDYQKIYDVLDGKKHLFHPASPLQDAFGRCIVMADASHSFGSLRDGRKSGELADFSCFSFHAVKNLTTGEGGAVTWRSPAGIHDDELYRQYMLLSLHGQSKDALEKTQLGAWEYDVVDTYYKCNMTDIMASLGLAQLQRYPALLARRRAILEQYDQALEHLPVDILRHCAKNYTSNGHLYMIRLCGKDEDFRCRFVLRMAERGIACNVHYKPLPMHTAYQKLGFDINDYPNAYNMFRNEVTLPLHTLLTDEQVSYVIENFATCLQGMESY